MSDYVCGMQMQSCDNLSDCLKNAISRPLIRRIRQ